MHTCATGCVESAIFGIRAFWYSLQIESSQNLTGIQISSMDSITFCIEFTMANGLANPMANGLDGGPFTIGVK